MIAHAEPRVQLKGNFPMPGVRRSLCSRGAILPYPPEPEIEER
jgi:hypothetical protein